MKVCHVITRLIIGGAQENTLLTCRGLVERGHEVVLAAGTETGPEGSLWPDAESCGARLVRLRHMVRAVRPMRDFAGVRELSRLFRDIRPDVVHTHSSKAGILGRLAADSARVPHIVHTIHGMSFNRTQPWVTQHIYRLLERHVARYTHAFITVADAMIDQAVAAGLAPRARFTTIRSGMDIEIFRPDAEERSRVRTAWNFPTDAVVIGTVARLFDNKGYDDIIAVMPRIIAAVPGAYFVWIGDGPRREAYRRQLATRKLLERVHFQGLVPPADVARLLRGMDILVHASRWEGLPRAVVQALLCEVPVVSFDNDGAREVILDGQTGFLARLGDHDGLADGVIRLARSSSERIRFGQEGRRRLVDEFDWRTMVAQIEAVYERVARSGSASQPCAVTFPEQPPASEARQGRLR